MNCSKQHSVAIQTIASRNAEKQRAARAMLAALKKYQDHYLNLDEPYRDAIAAIAQAEAAGIKVEG